MQQTQKKTMFFKQFLGTIEKEKTTTESLLVVGVVVKCVCGDGDFYMADCSDEIVVI